MAVLYNADQLLIADAARRLTSAHGDRQSRLAVLEATGTYDREFWQAAVAQGWPALSLPPEFDGLGLGLIELGVVALACGAATAGAPFLGSGDGAARALMLCDDPALRARWLPALAGGEVLAALAFAEGNAPLPEHPTAAFSDAGGGVLTGVKPGVTAGLTADIAIVWAQRNGEPALVLAELAGVERRPIASFDNGRLFADLVFAAAPARLLLSGEEARAAARDILARLAVVLAHEQVGGAEALLHTARDYANSRRAFGQPIGGFQSVKHRLAELYGLVEIARANALHAASCEGEPGFMLAAAAARLSAIEAYDTAARDAVQVHGGIGVTWEAGLHLHMRRARSLAIEAGNRWFWEDILVDALAAPDAAAASEGAAHG